jgi:L-fuculose-phosphate aldolase
MELDPSLMADLRQVGQDLYRFGLVTSHGGNLSVRLGSHVWITGTGKRLGYLEATDIACVSETGELLGGATPSSDTAIHLAVYRSADASAVVHAHAPHAVAITASAAVFVPEDLEGRYHLDDAPVVDQGPGAAERVAAALAERRVAILRDHGVYARGEDLWAALHWVMALEESARISWLRRSLVALSPAREE